MSGAAHHALGGGALNVQGHEEAIFHQAVCSRSLVWLKAALLVLIAIAWGNGGGNVEPDTVGFKVEKLGVFDFYDGGFAGE